MVLVGWALDVPFLKTVLPGMVSMKANTALCFLLLGLAGWNRRTLVSRCLAAAALLLSSLTLVEYVANIQLGLDQLFFSDSGGPGTSHPGRMSPVTALSFILAAAAQMTSTQGERTAKMRQGLSFAVLVMALSAFLGHVFSIGGLDSVWGLTRMAVHTAGTFILLATSNLLAVPDAGWMDILASKSVAGAFSRRLFPLALGLPLIGNILRLMGERAGFYDESTGIYLLITIGTCGLVFASIAGAQTLRLLELERNRVGVELEMRKELESLRHNFLSAVSHELRSPVGAIALFAKMIDSQLAAAGEGASKAREYAGRITSNADRLTAFIDDLLLVAQVEQGKLVLDLKPLLLQDAVRDLLAAYAKAAELRGIEIDNRISPSLPAVSADGQHLNRVLAHMISNALKFTPASGKVTITSGFHGDRDRPMVEVCVTDSGAGLTAEDASLLFQGFRQGSNIDARHAGPQGVGIGLHIVKLIAEAHGGHVQAESGPGGGATFRLSLPAA